PDTSYHVNCEFAYYANALTEPEAGSDDRARARTYFSMNNAVGGNWVPFFGDYDSAGAPPYGTGGTVTGSLNAIAAPAGPGQPATLQALFGYTDAHDYMGSPGNGTYASDDLCGSEFTGRVRLTIGSVCTRPSISQQPINAS